MQVWAILYSPEKFTDELYQSALPLVDPESQSRIKKFYHRADACRTLIGRLLPRLLLREQGLGLHDMRFEFTQAGKPYITSQMTSPIAFNVSHDNGLVAMVHSPGLINPPVYTLGVDVMKVRIPGNDTLQQFIDIMAEQLTPLEHKVLDFRQGVSAEEALSRFFWIWTMKEAYTKALGLGLGFNFSRVEFDPSTNTLRVDGQIPKGWQFHKFTLKQNNDLYQGVVAELVGGTETNVISERVESKPWLHVFDAADVVHRCMKELDA